MARKSICLLCIVWFLFGVCQISMASESNLQAIDDEMYLCSVLEGLERGDEALAGQYFDRKFFEDSKEPFQDMIRLWNGKRVTGYQKISESVIEADGAAPEKISYQYEVWADKEKHLVTFELYEEDAEIKMASFHFRYKPDITGTIRTWRRFNTFQWGVTFLGVFEVIFSIYMVVLCIQNKEKYRILWCLAILFLYGGIYAACLNKELHLGAYVYLWRLPQLLIYQNYGWELKASVPIGAIIYYIKWKRSFIHDGKTCV